MKHLLLLFSVLLVSLQQPLCAATHETTSTPDSVSLFAYATRGGRRTKRTPLCLEHGREALV